MSNDYRRQLVSIQQPHSEQDLRPQEHVVEPIDGPVQPAYGSRRLNIEDALSYLDQVKSQFQNQPNVYNKFLDIMKDFNTQRIDTPGVIERVSSLFKGHPLLVEGFNTFLPPGYSIVCSSDPNDPNPIRVTTPNGSITTGSEAIHASSHPEYPSQLQSQSLQPSNQPQPTPHIHQPVSYNGASLPPVNGSSQYQEQATSSPQSYATNYQLQHQEEDRAEQGPVEMDDAIGYVNKIKVRFTNEPHIYKSFLDLLQTYRREQRPIQEVYQQVSILFQNAPDLLADFKKFLPDPDALESSQSEALVPNFNSTVRYDYNYDQHSSPQQAQLPPLSYPQSESLPPQEPHAVNIRDDVQLPPFGNFQPPVKGTVNKKYSEEAAYSGERDTLRVDYLQKQQQQQEQQQQQHQHQQHQQKQQTVGYINNIQEVVPRSTLDEELSFFDKVKKHIANKNTYTNFIKLLNLFTNGVIDKRMLVERIEHYIGDSVELFAWFKKFMNYKDTPYHIENIEFKKHRLELGLCKRYGPSYRQLPKAETYMPCSGRDQMCWEVLNDEWVGHPTWDSEESGYIAHRKNQYEDNLFRIEEERHEYDFYMENNMRTIQTLEAIANRILTMTPQEKATFKLTTGLGHTSKTIYKKIIRKIYGKEKGFKVIDALHETPVTAVPIVLNRLKQKDEEWRKSHREWCKYWREQELKIFYKSLDHLGLTFKQTDKKLLTTKQLISEISSIKVEQSSNKRIIPLAPKPQDQLEYTFDDKEVLVDISRLVMTWIQASAYSANDKIKLSDFFNSFLGLFFNLLEDTNAKLAKLSESFSHVEEDTNKLTLSPQRKSSETVSRKRQREPDLLRDVLRKNKRINYKKDSTSSPSRDDGNNANDNGIDYEVADDISRAGETWIQVISKDNSVTEPDESILQDKNSKRSLYNLFCNTTIYVFFRYLQTLYDRLSELKAMNAMVEKEISERSEVPFAKDLDLLSHQLEEMGMNITHENCYGQVLDMSVKLIEGEIEHQWFEESLRQAYRNKAFKLFTVDKVVQGLVKHMHNITGDHKTSEMMLLFEQDRSLLTTTTRQQIVYRMRIRSLMNPEENMFRIEYNEAKNKVVIQFVALDDLTLKDKRTPDQQYNYYLTSYLMSHPTEGVPVGRINIPFVKSCVSDELDENGSIDGYTMSELKMHINKDDYKLSFDAGSTDEFTRYSVYNHPIDEKTVSKNTKDKVKKHFKEKVLDGEFGWKNGLEEADIKLGEDKFKQLVEKKGEAN